MAIIKETYKVEGMSCAVCAQSVESMLSSLNGVNSAVVNFASENVRVEFDEKIVSPEEFEKSIDSIGYKLITKQDKETLKELELKEHEKLKKSRQKAIFSILLAFPIFSLAMFIPPFNYSNWIMLFLTLPVLAWFGRDFFVVAYKQAKNKSTNMDTLVALSTATAFLFSAFNTIFPDFLLSKGIQPHVYFEAAVVIVALILLGRYLEDKAKSRTSESIKKLMELKQLV